MGVSHGIRFRSTVAAVLVVAVGLVAGAVALVALLRAELTDDVRQATRKRAEQVATVIESGRGVPTLAVAERDEQFIQVLDADGEVVAASANVEELPPLARPGRDGESRINTPLDEDEFLVVAVTANGPDGQKTVLVGRALIAVAESTQIVTRLLLVGLPLLLLLAAAATWMAVGRALAPVAAIRNEVEAISSTERRFLPFICLFASYPRVAFDTVSAPLTDWESTITRTGQGQRRRRSRSRRRSWSRIRLSTPAFAQRAKYPKQVRHGMPNSAGSALHFAPLSVM